MSISKTPNSPQSLHTGKECSTLIFVLAVALALAISGCDKPQQAPDAHDSTQTPPAAVPAPTPVVMNFDVKAASLPRGFSPHSPTAVYNAITNEDVSKGKFETEAKFMERMQSIARTVLYSQVALNGGFAFEPLAEAVSIRYDAEKENFLYEIRPSDIGHGHGYNAIELVRQDSNQNFPGIDSYFAEKFKKVRHTENTYLQIPSLKGLSYINGKFKAKPEEAKALDGKLSVLFVGRILAPYATNDVKYPFEASEDNVEHQRMIRFAIDGVWLVNLQTGDILTKVWAIKKY